MESNHNLTFDTKYSEMIKEKNFYRLLLSVKTDLRKSAKKDAKEFLSLITWSVRVLKENNEDDSAINLFIYALDEYEKTYNKAELTTL